MKIPALARADVSAFEGYSRLKIQSAIFLLEFSAGPLKAPLAAAHEIPVAMPTSWYARCAVCCISVLFFYIETAEER
jgi:hypothetical protein